MLDQSLRSGLKTQTKDFGLQPRLTSKVMVPILTQTFDKKQLNYTKFLALKLHVLLENIGFENIPVAR